MPEATESGASGGRTNRVVFRAGAVLGELDVRVGEPGEEERLNRLQRARVVKDVEAAGLVGGVAFEVRQRGDAVADALGHPLAVGVEGLSRVERGRSSVNPLAMV